jgi:hypothetical protein
MSAWTYSEMLEAHVYTWESYTGFVMWEADCYVAWVTLARRMVKRERRFTELTMAAKWCGDLMWEDWNASQAMHAELTGNFSQESE